MRSPSAAAAVLLALAVAFATLAVGATVSRSLIPHGVDGTVTLVEVRREKHPGVDDVWLVHLDDGRRLHVDADIATRLVEGARVRKPAWERRVTIDGTVHGLDLSDDATGMAWVMPLTLLAAGAAAAASLRTTRPRR